MINQTGALHDDMSPRLNGSWKWKTILGPMWKRLQEEEEEEVQKGSGIQMIPDSRQQCKCWKGLITINKKDTNLNCIKDINVNIIFKHKMLPFFFSLQVKISLRLT